MVDKEGYECISFCLPELPKNSIEKFPDSNILIAPSQSAIEAVTKSF
jgi:hypothetical protein